MDMFKSKTSFRARLLILSWLVVLLPQSMLGQGRCILTGRLLDEESQEGIFGARVQDLDGNGSLTDEEGRFRVEVGLDCQILACHFLGYHSITIDSLPKLNAGGQHDLGHFKMEVSSITLETVVFNGSSNNFKSGHNGANYYIHPREIQLLQPLSAEELLRTVPGVNVIGDMGLSNRPNISIRGSWGRRSSKILLLEDGSPAAPAPYIAPGAYYNPVSDRIEAIEVMKGADMLRFGPNNMYGAINYVTALPPSSTVLRGKFTGGMRGYTSGLLSYGGAWGNTRSLVEAVYKRFDGFTDNSSVEMLNLNAKVYAELGEKQSIYFKVSGQFEENQASLGALTPYSYRLSPRQNPLDADVFGMSRFGADIVHKLALSETTHLTTRIYTSTFERDWWRQITRVIPAGQVRQYVGDSAYWSRFSYLEGNTAGEGDYVRVGRVVNGRESTSNSRWKFTVAGIEEHLDASYTALGGYHQLEASAKLHTETYWDQFLLADSSRWARSGRTTRDMFYKLSSASGFVRNESHFGEWAFTPILRVEHVGMWRQDRLALALQPGLNSATSGRVRNNYTVLMPGATLSRRLGNLEAYAGAYRGFIAPSEVFAFLSEQGGDVAPLQAGQVANMRPETSINSELGLRGTLLEGKVDGQLAVFNGEMRNFYLGGRNETFVQLGQMRVSGLELAVNALAYKSRTGKDRLVLSYRLGLARSRVLSGELADTDLIGAVIHSQASRQELADKVTAHAAGYRLYRLDGQGRHQLYAGPLTAAGVDSLSKIVLVFGGDGIRNGQAPYTPAANTNVHLTYTHEAFSMGGTWTYVSRQYAEFANFSASSADGAIGAIPSFQTWDVNANYTFELSKKGTLTVFLAGKNLGNRIYLASRLNRAASGLFPGGFRQVNGGISVEF
jgi:Fe(3+) dicitrate transport protein